MRNPSDIVFAEAMHLCAGTVQQAGMARDTQNERSARWRDGAG